MLRHSNITWRATQSVLGDASRWVNSNVVFSFSSPWQISIFFLFSKHPFLGILQKEPVHGRILAPVYKYSHSTYMSFKGMLLPQNLFWLPSNFWCGSSTQQQTTSMLFIVYYQVWLHLKELATNPFPFLAANTIFWFFEQILGWFFCLFILFFL